MANVFCSCAYCGEEMVVHESEVVRGRGVYCSRSCRARWQSIERVKVDTESSLDEFFWENHYE